MPMLADTKVMPQLEVQEGAEIMSTKEYVADYKLAGTAQVLRLSKPWHGSGRAISALIQHLPVLYYSASMSKKWLTFYRVGENGNKDLSQKLY